MLRAINQIINDIHTIPHTVYQEFSYGFFGVICLVFAIIIHINNTPNWYIEKTDTLINYIEDIYFRLITLKDNDKVLPLYTPLETVKNINNKTFAVDIYDYTIRNPRYKIINKIEDV